MHPLVREALPSKARIANVGCSTGAYLAQPSDSLPSIPIFDGFDVFLLLLSDNGALALPQHQR